MRKRGLLEIENLILENKDMIFIGSDLGPEVLENVKNRFPDQFYMEGISEAHVLGMASGLAMDGHRVYVNTIATFFVKRAFEQLAIDICAENLNVCIYGNGGGLVYGPLGHTHTCLDDFSILQSLPNLTILAPADENEMAEFVRSSASHNGPIYIRLGKGGDSIVTAHKKIEIGKANLFGKEAGDVLLISTGVMLQRCLISQEALSKENVLTSVLHFSTIKPFDRESLIKHVKKFKSVIVVEEHVRSGGLGSIISQELFKEKIIPESYFHFHLGDDYIADYGRQEELLDLIGITPKEISAKARESIR